MKGLPFRWRWDVAERGIFPFTCGKRLLCKDKDGEPQVIFAPLAHFLVDEFTSRRIVKRPRFGP
jgi:hypothetical protein